MRWLAIPAAILVLVLASLAIDTESRQGFIDRVKIEQAQQERFEDQDATRLFFETAEGDVVEFSLNDGEVLGRGSDGDIKTLVFEPDPDGNVAGMVVNDDGTFTPFAPGDDVSGETILVPTADGGFSLIQPDGSVTQIQVGENGIQAVDRNGNDLDLDRDSDGRIDLGDGLSARDTDIEFVDGDPGGDQQALPEDSGRDSNGSSWIPSGRNLIIILIALLAIAGTAWWFVAMKPKFHLREGPVLAPVEVAGHRPATTWEAFEAYLAELLANPDPTQAIRQVYAYAEQGMGHLIPRHSEQTPIEWCAAVATTEPELASILRNLTNRYSAIRFGDRVGTSEQRDQAVAELRSLVQRAFQ
jgi:hypothetical protein